MNKIIKVIDLINMIAKGEKAPKRLKIDGMYYDWNEGDECYINYNTDSIDLRYIEGVISIDSRKSLNDEVEIIDEEPKEKLTELQEYDCSGVPKWTSSEMVIVKTLNKIIRKLENKDE